MAGQVAEERSHLVRPHVPRMTKLVEVYEAANPADVGLLGAQAVVATAQMITDLVQQTGLEREFLLRIGAGRVDHGCSPIEAPGRSGGWIEEQRYVIVATTSSAPGSDNVAD
jgi:hypothetical protein